jgi:glycosyltransferase involved in cell wall biosynthesis
VAVDGQARKIVEEAGAGIFVEPEDSHALAEAIRLLAVDPERRRRMGISGRQYIVSRLSRERTAHTYISVLQNLKPVRRVDEITAGNQG